MDKEKNQDQFNMSYSGDDRFAGMLADPSFTIILEMPPADEAASAKELLKHAAEVPSVFAIVLSDRCDAAPSKKQLSFAEDAISITAKPVVSYISGKGVSKDDVLATVNKLRELGLRDFVAVTGDLEKGTVNYLDSAEMVKLISEHGNDNCIGAVVNPFKYLHEDQFAQYSKLVEKVEKGAHFIVTQAGWDMKKYQELIWFLRSREVLVPVMARIMVIDTADADMLASNLHPGVAVPLCIAADAQRNANDPVQFTQSQTYTAAFIAAGCRFMGYNGIQLSGIHTAGELDAFLANLDAVTSKYPDFSSWCTAWNEKYFETALYPALPNLEGKKPFYLYDALMTPALQEFDARSSEPSQHKLDAPSFSDRMRYMFLANENTPEWVRKAARSITRCKYTDEQLAGCKGIDPELCPKGLLHAPCGNSTPDGLCECGSTPCVFQRILRIANNN